MKQQSWFKHNRVWLTGIIVVLLIIIGGVGLKGWQEMKTEQQEAQIKTTERRLVVELVRHYSGVKQVRFHGLSYNQMTGSTTYGFFVNNQTDMSSYLVEAGPGKFRGTPEIRYSEAFFNSHERNQPVPTNSVEVRNIKISYATELKKG